MKIPYLIAIDLVASIATGCERPTRKEDLISWVIATAEQPPEEPLIKKMALRQLGFG